MDYLREDCDNLLGKDRNLPLKEKISRKKHFDDREVCSFYLIDFCPHDLFPNKKSDLGPCKKRHDNFYKIQYENNPNKKEYKIRYEEILEGFLERLVLDVDNKIRKAVERIEAPIPETQKSLEVQNQIKLIDEKIQEFAEKAEKLGEEGLIDQSEEIMKQIDILTQEKYELEKSNDNPFLQRERQMIICEICGGFQSSLDTEKRLQTHNEGKLHSGYAMIREKLNYLRQKREKRYLNEEKEKEREKKLILEKFEKEKAKEVRLDEINLEENVDLGNYFDPNAFEKKFRELKDFPGRGGRGRGRGGGRGGGFLEKREDRRDDRRENRRFDERRDNYHKSTDIFDKEFGSRENKEGFRHDYKNEHNNKHNRPDGRNNYFEKEQYYERSRDYNRDNKYRDYNKERDFKSKR